MRLPPNPFLILAADKEFAPKKLNLVSAATQVSSFLLERAKSLYSSSGRTFLSGNAYDLPLPSQSFDAAFSILVWHLLMNLEKAASELSRVLVENGQFLILTANPDAYLAWKAFYPDAKITGKKLEGTMQLGAALSGDVLYLHSFDEINEYFQRAGLKIEHMEIFLPAKDFEKKMLISLRGKKTAGNSHSQVRPGS